MVVPAYDSGYEQKIYNALFSIGHIVAWTPTEWKEPDQAKTVKLQNCQRFASRRNDKGNDYVLRLGSISNRLKRNLWFLMQLCTKCLYFGTNVTHCHTLLSSGRDKNNFLCNVICFARQMVKLQTVPKI